MSKDSYSYIYECFCIDNADQFIRKRQDKFLVDLAVTSYLGHFKNSWLIDWLID